MPNGTSAAPIAGGDLAPAMANTDMLMPTRTDRTKSLIPGFAQVLESSFESTGHMGDSRASKLMVPAKLRSASSSDHPSSSTNWTATQLPQPVVSTQPQIAYGFSPTTITTLATANSDGSVAQPAATEQESVTTLSASAPATFANQISDLQSAESVAPSLGPGAATTFAPSMPSPSVQQQNVSSIHGGTVPSTAPNQTAQSLAGSPLTEPSVSPGPTASSQPASTDAASIPAVPFIAPSFLQQAPPISQGWTADHAQTSVTGVSTPKTGPTQAVISQIDLSTPDAMTSPLQTAPSTMAAPARDPSIRQHGLSAQNSLGKSVTDVSAVARVAASQQSAAPVPTATGSSNTQSVEPPSFFSISLPANLASSVSATWHSTSTQAATQPAPAILGTDNTEPLTATNKIVVDTPVASPPTAESTPNEHSSTPNLQPDAPFVGPDISASGYATYDAASSAQAIPLAAPAQDPADPTTTATTPTQGPAVSRDQSSETAAIVDMWTKQGAQVAVTGLSSSSVDNSKSSESQTVPFASSSAISPLQAAQGAIAASVFDPSPRQQKLPTENSVGKAKVDTTAAPAVAAPRQFAISNAIATGSPRIQSLAPPASVTASLPSMPVSSVPASWDNTTALNSTTSPSANFVNGDSSTPTLTDKTAPGYPADLSQPADSGTDQNSHQTNSQPGAPAVSPELFAPAPAASDVPASTQTVCLTSALRPEPSSSAPSGASLSPSGAAGDAQLPSAVVVHRAAEAAELSTGLQAWNGGDNAQTRMVQSARLAGNAGESEMNIALRADALGAVELRAHVTGDLVGASISVERHDAHALLSNDLGTLHQALNDRQLRVGDVKVFQGGLGSDATAADGQSSQRRETAPQRASSANWTSAHSAASADSTAFADIPDANIFFDSNGRLSVRA